MYKMVYSYIEVILFHTILSKKAVTNGSFNFSRQNSHQVITSIDQNASSPFLANGLVYYQF